MRVRRARLVFLPMVGLVLACGKGPDSSLGEAVLAPAKPDPLSVRLAPGGDREERIALARPNRTQAGMRVAPELFAATGEVFWDGKPTLGGLWIAHPDAAVSRRVRMHNPETGTTIDGALLPRRNETAAGLVISAEAADALGLLPSVPAVIEVVAIEPRAVIASAAEDGATTQAGPGATDEAAPNRQPGDTAEMAVAAPAMPAADAAVVSDSDRQTEALDHTGQAQAELPAAALAAAPPEQDSEDGPPGAFEPDVPLLAAATVSKEQPTDATQTPPSADGAAQPFVPAVVLQERESGQSSAADGSSPPDASAAVPASPSGGEETAKPLADPGPRAPGQGGVAPDAPQGGTPIADGRDYIQAGYFTVPEHAADLVRTLAARGIPARNQKETVRGTDYNRVIAGPFANREARERALQQLRAIGITDARPLAG